MIGFIDNKIGMFLLRILHRRRQKIIADALQEYRNTHNADDKTLAALKNKLEFEMTRVFAIADESIVRERILRARYTFWISAIAGTTFVLAFAAFPVTTSLAPFFAPLVSGIVAWLTAICTIPIGYNTRVKGAVNSTIAAFKPDRAEKHRPDLQNTVRGMQLEIVQMRRQVNQLSAAPQSSFWKTPKPPESASNDGFLAPKRRFSF